MDNRLKHICKLLASYSAGDFDKRLRVSERLDDADAVIGGLHMLAEELKAVTISRDYFNNIFNAVSEMVLVLTAGGVIEDLNDAVCNRLGYLRGALIGRGVDVLTGGARPSLFRQLKRQRGPDGLVRIWNRSFLTAHGEAFLVDMTARVLVGNGPGKRPGMLVTVRDVGARLMMENRMLRTMIDAQELERQRLSRDLHDSLGQQLSAVKFLVGAAVKESASSPWRERLQAANESLVDVLGAMREICYNLMPKTLDDFGLVRAVRELAEQAEKAGLMRVVVEEGRGFPALARALEVDLFRVIQEFMNNGIRHGEATHLLIRLEVQGHELEVRLRENGKGFEPAMVQGKGMGLRNMLARIKSHDGVFHLDSSPGKGTAVRILVGIDQ